MLHIGVNALYLIPGGVGGTEIYLHSLLNGLCEALSTNHRITVFVNRRWTETPGLAIFRCNVDPSNRPARLIYEQTLLPWYLRQLKIDVLLNPGFTGPLLSPCPTVTVFHDLQHKVHPEFFRALDLPFWNLLLAQSASSSTALLAISEATAKDLARFYPNAANKITVIPHGVDPSFSQIIRRPSYPPFFLTVCTTHPHKNLDRLLRAFANFPATHRLVVAGLEGFAHKGLLQLRRDLRLNDRVEFTGWIPRVQLLDLFARADAAIFPTLFEGFGLPVTEALAAGLPTACSNIAPFAPYKNATVQFDPMSESAIVDALYRITRNAIGNGPETVAHLTWTATAQATLKLLQATAKQGGR